MTSLRDLQVAFVEALRVPQQEAVIAHILGGDLDPARRVGIYRNNLREGFLKTLAATFPIVCSLGGEPWFRQTGLQYLAAHPSRSGNLHHIGERFATFLEGCLESDFGYFADVARLEWAYQECMVAADGPELDATELAQVSPDDYESLSFEIHPAVLLVRSTYPLLAIWRAHQPGGDDVHVDLRSGPSNVLLTRHEDHVELREIDDATAIVVTGFMRGDSLAQVTSELLSSGPTSDLGQTINTLFRLKISTHIKGHSHEHRE